MRPRAWATIGITFLALAASCSKGGSGKEGLDTAPVDPDGDGTDTDIGSDTDTDTDSDTDTDTDAGPPIDCAEDLTGFTPPPGGVAGECITQEIGCGDVILHTNEGGSTVYDKGFWEDQQELATLMGESADVLDGPERVYVLRGHENGVLIEITVESCADVWASWRRYGDLAYAFCDVDEHFFEAGHFTRGDQRVQSHELVNGSSGEYTYEIIVDSYHGGVGNYRLTVECW